LLYGEPVIEKENSKYRVVKTAIEKGPKSDKTPDVRECEWGRGLLVHALSLKLRACLSRNG